MPAEAAREKKRPVPEFQQQRPEFEKSIRKVSVELTGAKMKGEGEKVRELEGRLSALLKQRKAVLKSTPTPVEKREGAVEAEVQGGVSVRFENGRAAYSQRRKLPELFDEQPRKAPKVELRHAP